MEEVNHSKEFSVEEIAQVSVILSNCVFFTMASACKTNAQRNAILMEEFLYFVRHKQLLRRYFGGSAAEGTNLSTSDIDKMIVARCIYVCSDPADAKNVRGHVFLVDSQDSSQGYAKLVLLKSDSGIPTIFDDNGCPIKDMLEQNKKGKLVLPSEKVVQFWINFLGKRQTATGPPETFQHGPCATAVNKDPQGYIKKEVGELIEQDFAHGLPFCRVPVEGEQWLRSRRHFNWPSMKTLEKIRTLDCHVVAVGDKISQHSSLEWRISYLLWERELVWSFNDTQLQCFVLLKSLLIKFIDPIVSEKLSSYHMKTVVFWESETIDDNCWRREFLLTFLKNCLLRLKDCVEKQTLMHFIDRSKNLFFGRLDDPEIKERILEILEDILQNILVISMKCIDDIDLETTWQNSHGNVDEFLYNCTVDHPSNITSDFEASRHSLELYHSEQVTWGINVGTALSDFKTLAEYHVALEDKNIASDFDEGFKRSVGMFVLLRSAIIQAVLMLRSEEANTSEKFQRLVNFMDEKSDIDALSGKLYAITVLFAFGKKEEAYKRIKNVFFRSESSAKYIYVGLSSTCKTIEISQQTITQTKGIPKCQNPQKIIDFPVAYDMIFAKEEISLVAKALKFECLAERSFLVHPVVYASYLRVLCCDKEEKVENIGRLHEAVKECKGTKHNYRHFNILGHCYHEAEFYEEACRCYLVSLSQTSGDGRPNAAVLMLLVCLFNYMQMQVK